LERFLLKTAFPAQMDKQNFDLIYTLAPFIGIIAGGIGIGLLRAEIMRRQDFKRYLQSQLHTSAGSSSSKPEDNLGDIEHLVRVYWNDDVNGYVNSRSRPIGPLEGLKNTPLNFHWSWGDDDLVNGLRSHILEEALLLGADAYSLSEPVSGHGNPMYSLTFFKFFRQTVDDVVLQASPHQPSPVSR
jgi:hypothetical protein